MTPLHVWLVTTGEPLPVDGGHVRLFRTGLLAAELARAGHRVTWWSAAFNHSQRRHRSPSDASYEISNQYTLELLWSPGYQRTISLRRLVDHHQIGRRFAKRAKNVATRPDIIVSSWPLIELCEVSVRAGIEWRIPVILDVRDLWPDIFVNLAPGPLRGAARWALRSLFKRAQSTFAKATAVTGINSEFVDWGIDKGGRRPAAGPWFPLGYPRISVSDEAVQPAAEYWRGLGVTPESGMFVVCFFGVFGRTLDLDTVVGAAKMMAGAPVQWVLCGNGEFYERLRQQTSNLKNVVLPGWIDANRIHALMRIANAGLAPYRNTSDFQASIPNKAVEYMAGGLPILTCLQGQLGSLIAQHDIGEVYRQGDATSLAQAVEHMRVNPTRLAAQAKRVGILFEDRFEASQVYRDYANFICDIAERARANSERRDC